MQNCIHTRNPNCKLPDAVRANYVRKVMAVGSKSSPSGVLGSASDSCTQISTRICTHVNVGYYSRIDSECSSAV
jgi:hypothetical protein